MCRLLLLLLLQNLLHRRGLYTTLFLRLLYFFEALLLCRAINRTFFDFCFGRSTPLIGTHFSREIAIVGIQMYANENIAFPRLLLATLVLFLGSNSNRSIEKKALCNRLLRHSANRQ